jgi:hypothetical protein
MASLSRRFSVKPATPVQLLKRCFGELIEEEAQGKTYHCRKCESRPTIFTVE